MRYIGQEFIEPVENINPITLCRYVDEIMKNPEALNQELMTVGEDAKAKALENTRLALELLESGK